MGYISAQQAATKWGISKRRVQVLCTENRIKNATRIGNMWVVPEDALKPADGRVQTHHTVESPTARAARTALKKLTVNAYQEINGKLNNPSTSKMVFVSLLATTIFCDIQNDESSKPEILYDALLASEFCVQPERVGYKIDKVSRDIAGAYYTSSDFSAQITYRALESYMDRKRRRAIDSDSFACCNEYENITFLDYSCGCGEFLLAVIQYFDNHVLGYSRKKLATQLRGVDVNPIALMITIARIVSAVEAEDDENLLREVAKNFIVGNPLLHSDKIAPLEVRFDNFALNRLYAETEGINCLELEQQNLVVLGNPPWEKLRFEERTFFRPVCPAISAISQKNKREKEIKKLAVNWLELLEYYQLLQDDYASVKKEIPKHPLLKVSLVGELNTYERCMMCINQNGAIILPIPAMANSAFSVELFLKAVIKEKTSECRSHKLSDLFNRLPIEIQQEIMNETNHSDFETQIERFSDAFVDFRYIYEDIFKTKDLNLEFWEDFSSAIYKIVPTHIARKGAPLYIDPSIK